jgi:hypothetical protein
MVGCTSRDVGYLEGCDPRPPQHQHRHPIEQVVPVHRTHVGHVHSHQVPHARLIRAQHGLHLIPPLSHGRSSVKANPEMVGRGMRMRGKGEAEGFIIAWRVPVI